jgi:chromosome segregation ATPase
VSERRDRRHTGPTPSGLRYRVEQHAVLRDRVGHHLATLEQVVDTLRRELSERRDEIRSLSAERDRLRSDLARLDMLEADKLETETLWRHERHEYEREARAGQTLELEKQQLVQHCARLEQALAVEQDERRTLMAEVQCLQDQVVQLTEIVSLLMAETGEE